MFWAGIHSALITATHLAIVLQAVRIAGLRVKASDSKAKAGLSAQFVEQRYQQGLIRESGVHGKEVPCIASRCEKPDHVKNPMDQRLCHAALQQASQCTESWRQAASVAMQVCPAEITQDNAQNQALVKRLFGRGGCDSAGFCDMAFARLLAMQVVCGESKDAHPACNELHGQDALGVTGSLSKPCTVVKSDASRSDAVILRSEDELYIVKSIKRTEMPTLLRYKDEFETQPLLVRWRYIDPGKNVVVMPNAHHPSEYALSVVQTDTASGRKQQMHVSINYMGRWDLKPLPITSAHRPTFLAMLVEREWRLRDMKNWDSLVLALQHTFAWLEAKNLIDYSLIPTLFEYRSRHSSKSKVALEGNHCLFSSVSPSASSSAADAGAGVGAGAADSSETVCEALCFKVIDYLMEFTMRRQMENLAKGKRWTNWAEKMASFLNCLGDLTQVECIPYLQIGCDQFGSPSPWCTSRLLSGDKSAGIYEYMDSSDDMVTQLELMDAETRFMLMGHGIF